MNIIRFLLGFGVLLLVIGSVWFFGHFSQEKEPPVRASPSVPPQIIAQTAQDPGFSIEDEKLAGQLRAHFQAGNYAESLKIIDQVTANPESTVVIKLWMQKQKPPVLVSLAWLKIKLSQCDEAMNLLSQLEDLSSEPLAMKAQAYCLYKEKNFAKSLRFIQDYLKLDSQDFDMRMIYVEVLESLGEYDQATNYLESLNKDFADHGKEIAKRLKSMRAKLREASQQVSEQSQHFKVSYDQRIPADVSAKIVDMLEESLRSFSELLQYQVQVFPIEVVMYAANDFPAIVGEGPSWADGIYDGRIRIPVRASNLDPRFWVTLRHELVHAIFSDALKGRKLPSWFDEGMAQFLSCLGYDCAQFRFGPTPGVFFTPLEFDKDFFMLSDVRAAASYSQSLYLIHYVARFFGYEGFVKVMRDVVKPGAITSDRITLQFSEWTFNQLCEKIKPQWSARVLFRP